MKSFFPLLFQGNCVNNLSREREEVFPEREGMATVWAVVCSEMLNTAALSPCQPWGLCKNAGFFSGGKCLAASADLQFTSLWPVFLRARGCPGNLIVVCLLRTCKADLKKRLLNKACILAVTWLMPLQIQVSFCVGKGKIWNCWTLSLYFCLHLCKIT